MCGIVGYVGPRDASDVVVGGLQRLEYRGYDSAGVAIVYEGDLLIRRSVGKLGNLQRKLGECPAFGHQGIGHTRWATHGSVTENNAHPHRSQNGDIVVIQNGIVENYLTLKHDLQANGYVFDSQTDTEVIAHLIERETANTGNFQAGFARALGMLKGGNAVVAMSVDEPDLILAARLGHAGAVVIGEGEGEQFVASDMPAILDYTQRMVFLEDHEIAILRPGKVEYCRLDGTTLEKTAQHVAWDPIAAVKGGFKHFMLKEIFEQPRSITDTIHDRIDLEEGRVYLPDLRMSDEELRHIDRIYTIACGTAWHAGLVGKFLIESLAGVRVEVDYGSEFRYRDPLLDKRTVLMVVTQSGETADTLAGMAIARAAGVKSIGIVNAVGSQVARIADGGVVYLNAGIEISVASTKAFTCMVVAQYLLALKLAQVRGRLSPDQVREHLGALLALPNKIGTMLEETDVYERLAERFRHTTDMLFLGRGINYPIALEGALKLKELSYIHAEGYPAGEMKHGPIALIDDEMPVVCIAPADGLYEKMLSQVEQAQARGGQVIAIVTEGDTIMRSKADWIIEVPATDPLLTPVLTVIPLQLLAYYIAVDRGADVDQPRNLAKSVTVE